MQDRTRYRHLNCRDCGALYQIGADTKAVRYRCEPCHEVRMAWLLSLTRAEVVALVDGLLAPYLERPHPPDRR